MATISGVNRSRRCQSHPGWNQWPRGAWATVGDSGAERCVLSFSPESVALNVHFVGAGKTTLIDVLANKNKTGYTSGSVRFPSDPSREARTPRIGFVPQQDVLPVMLTVSEALLFAARLRLPEYVTDAEKRQRVEDVLEQLGLTRVRDSRIGGRTSQARGISGGEMRRVSIGLELVASPDVLILDEPTSGSSL